MALTKERMQELVKEHGRDEMDTGNTEVQVALLTERINQITKHLQGYSKDHHSRHGLLKLVGKRRSLLEYLSSRDIEKYRSLIKKLNIRK
ncbi:MAG: 30S ribosomal protein S15 [Chitinispirillaceae bacterium]|nr:30S ribosomal protein S15 [Chitinispirillaceae bacterium]